MGVEKMSDSPWHVEKMTRKEGDEKRHRSRCVNYRKEGGACKVYCEKCHGSAHCPYYSEVKIEDELPSVSDIKAEEEFPVDSLVHHLLYGYGIVKEISDGMITIQFDNSGETSLDLNFCFEHDLLKLCTERKKPNYKKYYKNYNKKKKKKKCKKSRYGRNLYDR